MPRKIKPIPPPPLEVSQYLTGNPDPQINPNDIRGLQTSMSGSSWKDYSVGLKDINESIKYYFNNIIKPSVIQNNQKIKVPIIYGSPERWKSVQADGYYRDKDGKLMIPLIMYKSDTVEKNRNLGNKLDGNEAHLFQIFEARYNKNNVYDAFSVLNNRKPSKQLYLSIVPDYVTITYNCILFTEYVEQINTLIEAINFASDSYWGDPKNFMFKARIDSFSISNELNNGEDRSIKADFNIILNGYIIADSVNEKLASLPPIMYSTAQIVLGLEIETNGLNNK
jgi:hypothetical protein